MRYLASLLVIVMLLAACPAPPPATTGEVTAEIPTLEPVGEEAEETPARVEEETPEIAETPEITETVEVAETPEVTVTAEITGTPEVEMTPEITPTAEMTETAGEITTATAQLQNVDGEIVGTAMFTETQPGVVEIHVEVSGFEAAAAGEHGIHIHETGQCTPDFQAAGDHFNPTDAQHGLENPEGPHAGDLPNIEIDAEGNGTYEATNDRITLAPGEQSLFDEDGSALIIHANPDDQMTDPDGNSGDPIACGAITQGQ